MTLKPCPFCGGDAQPGAVNDGEGGHFIACVKCGASTNLRFACGDGPLPMLIEQWNRRAALDAQAEPMAQDCGHEACDCRGYCKRAKRAETVELTDEQIDLGARAGHALYHGITPDDTAWPYEHWGNDDRRIQRWRDIARAVLRAVGVKP